MASQTEAAYSCPYRQIIGGNSKIKFFEKILKSIYLPAM
jgi:hypothetical protein